MQKFITEAGVDEIIRQHEDGNYALVGLKCKACGHINFPALKTCIKCGENDMEDTELAGSGTLYTYCKTMRPVNHMPAGIVTGYIDLDDGVRIYAPVDVEEGSEPEIGSKMEVCFRALWTEEDGTEVLGYTAREIEEA